MIFYILHLFNDDTPRKAFDAENDDEAIAVARGLYIRCGGFGFKLWEARPWEARPSCDRLVRREIHSLVRQKYPN